MFRQTLLCRAELAIDRTPRPEVRRGPRGLHPGAGPRRARPRRRAGLRGPDRVDADDRPPAGRRRARARRRRAGPPRSGCATCSARRRRLTSAARCATRCCAATPPTSWCSTSTRRGDHDPGRRPAASALARHQARDGEMVTNLRHTACGSRTTSAAGSSRCSTARATAPRWRPSCAPTCATRAVRSPPTWPTASSAACRASRAWLCSRHGKTEKVSIRTNVLLLAAERVQGGPRPMPSDVHDSLRHSVVLRPNDGAQRPARRALHLLPAAALLARPRTNGNAGRVAGSSPASSSPLADSTGEA